jgi:phosphoribosylanthranilate isomerase
MTPRIKICGIGNQADARVAAGLGVDALGFVFAESPRRVDPEVVRKICLALPPFISKVGVFVDEDAARVSEIARFCRLDCVQLHGNESPQYCQTLDLPVLKAFRVRDEVTLSQLTHYRDCVQGFVLDTYVSGKAGGTGQPFDWRLARGAEEWGPVILSGGLSAENVARAVEQVRPYGVDVSSGVESAPAVKDRDKMRRFVESVRMTS